MDFGCGIGIGEYIFKNLYFDSNIIYSSYSRKSRQKIYADFFEECQKVLNVNAYFYSGDSRSSLLDNEYNKLEFLTKADTIADTLLIFRLSFSKGGLDQLINKDMLISDCNIISDDIINPEYDVRLEKQDLNINQNLIYINL